MAQFYDSSTSPFYRSRFPRPPVLDKGNLGPPIFGPYQQRWNPHQRAWFRPDGSRASLAGFGGFGEGGTLPELDLTASSEPEVVDRQTFVALAVAIGLGLTGGWALQKHHKLTGYTMLGLGGVAAVTAVLMLKRNIDARNGYIAWNAAPAPPPPGGHVPGQITGWRG